MTPPLIQYEPLEREREREREHFYDGITNFNVCLFVIKFGFLCVFIVTFVVVVVLCVTFMGVTRELFL